MRKLTVPHCKQCCSYRKMSKGMKAHHYSARDNERLISGKEVIYSPSWCPKRNKNK